MLVLVSAAAQRVLGIRSCGQVMPHYLHRDSAVCLSTEHRVGALILTGFPLEHGPFKCPVQEFAFLLPQMLFIREGGSRCPVRAAYLEDIIPGAHVCDIHPLAINVMSIGVPTTDSHSLLPEVGTGIAPLQSCKEGGWPALSWGWT